MTDLDAIRERHQPKADELSNLTKVICGWDGEDWPCDTAQALARVAELEAALAFIADWAHDCSPSNMAAPTPVDPSRYGFDDIEDRARALLARPESET